MTDVLDRPAGRSDRPLAASSGPAATRPLWLTAAFAGAFGATAVLTACMAVGLAAWFASDAGAHGDTRDAIRVGAVAWLLAHGSGLALGTVTIGLVPLGLTGLSAYVVFRLGRWSRMSSADETAPGLTLAALVLAGVYALVALATALLASVPAARPGLMPAFSGAFGLALLGGGLGMARPGDASGWSGRMSETLRATLRAGVRGGVAMVAAMLAAGALLVTVALVLDYGAAASTLSRLHVDAPGGSLLTLVVAAVAPNAALLGSAYLLGPGFAVGTGTIVSPANVVLGPLPSFPLLAALPAAGPGVAWVAVLLGMPALVAVGVGFLTVRRHPTMGYQTAAVRGLAAGLLGALLLAVLVALAGGAVGPGRMSQVGSPFADVLGAAAVGLGLGGLLGGVAAAWWLRRADHAGPVKGEQSPVESDDEIEDTIRLS